VPTSSRASVAMARVRIGFVLATAILAAACTTSGSKHGSTSAAPPQTVSATAGTPTSAASATSAPPASSAPASSAAASPPASAPASGPPPIVVVDLSRSDRVVKGGPGTIDVDELSVTGLAASAAVSSALEAPATQALSDYMNQVASNPCTGPACGNGDYEADFTTTRDDSVVVSGTWTIESFLPGAAHPTTELTGVIVDASDGATITASQLFLGTNLDPLAAATASAAKAHLHAIGCPADEGDIDLSDGTAATADNYAGTAVGATGLLVGLSQGQVAAEACGSFEVGVAWGALQAQLNTIGTKLAAPPPTPASAYIRAGAPATPSPLSRCLTTSLAISLGATTQVATGQFRLPIDFTDVSSQPCTLLGFPGVDLGAAATDPLSLARAAGTPARVVLAPGASAHADLTYLTGPDPACDTTGAWTPTTITITPPDETTSVQMPWAGHSVDDCQAAATHPGSYIGAVVS
jgi:Protein of unknown function (DUF4232)